MCAAGERGTAGKVLEQRRDWGMSEAEHRNHGFRDSLLHTNIGSGFFPFKMGKIMLAETRKKG